MPRHIHRTEADYLAAVKAAVLDLQARGIPPSFRVVRSIVKFKWETVCHALHVLKKTGEIEINRSKHGCKPFVPYIPDDEPPYLTQRIEREAARVAAGEETPIRKRVYE